MESGGDVKFFSPGAPVRPHFSFSHRFSSLRSDGGTRDEKFYITAWLHTQKEPYSAIRNIFKKYPEFLRGIKPTPERILGFPLNDLNRESLYLWHVSHDVIWQGMNLNFHPWSQARNRGEEDTILHQFWQDQSIYIDFVHKSRGAPFWTPWSLCLL